MSNAIRTYETQPPPPPLHGGGEAPRLPSAPVQRVVVGYRYRARWENVLAAVAVVILAVVFTPFLIDAAHDMVTPALPSQVAKAPAPVEASDSGPGPAEARAIMEQARLAMQAGQFDKARQLLLQIDTDEASALRDQNAERERQYSVLGDEARDFASRGKWAQVRKVLADARAIAPLSAELEKLERKTLRQLVILSSLRKARALADQGKLREALREAQTGYRRYPDARLKTLVSELQASLAARRKKAQAAAAARQSQQLHTAPALEEIARAAPGKAGDSPPIPTAPPPGG